MGRSGGMLFVGLITLIACNSEAAEIETISKGRHDESAAVVTGAKEAPFDISGVRVGDLSTEVVEAMRRASPGVTIKRNFTGTPDAEYENQRPPQNFDEIRAVSDEMSTSCRGPSSGCRPRDSWLALENDDSEVWYVSRQQVYDEGSRFEAKVLVQALKEKYGEPHHESITNRAGMLKWWYSPFDGRVIPSGALPRACKPGPIRPNMFNTYASYEDIKASYEDIKGLAACGILIQASFSNLDGLVGSFSVSIFDQYARNVMLAKRIAAIDLSRAKRREAEIANQPKPQL